MYGFIPKFILIFCILLLIYPSYALSDNQENLDALRDRIQTLQKDIISKAKEKQDASNALRETERAISTINRKQKQLLEEKHQADQKFKHFKTQYQQLSVDIALEQNRLDKLLYQQYVNGQQDHLRLLLNQQNPNQLARDMHYFKHLSLARTNTINTLHNNKKKLEVLTQAIQNKRAEIITIQNEYSTQSSKLKQQKLKHQTILSQVSEQIAKQQNEVEKLQRDEKRIADVVTKINKILSQQKNSPGLYNNELPKALQGQAPFSSLKGKLHLPVRGKLVSRFGGQRSSGRVTWKGLFISSPKGSDVKAIANGQVVFADWLRGFGNLMIIDHGKSYMSLYGNNETLYKEVGDIIQSGDTITAVGNSGGNQDSGLYFELRHKGQPFDPLTWIKIE
ncbi:MAG: peptidoglycan DD-metalloendopeptidase family protein [Betaproteobacteria bacterium]|nr:peptidoglycan DD-metalloendopeptidase family protein [Betaproteobacteria bacterium]